MKEALTAAVVANFVRMLRESDSTITICIVEGADDKKRLKAFFDDKRCRFVIADGWERAVGALDRTKKSGYNGVLAIIDADHRRLTHHPSISPNLFWSDFHDFEIDLIETSAFDRLVGEVCDMEKRPHPPAAELRRLLLQVAIPLACLRLYSTGHNLGLKFRTITYSEFINKETFEVDYLAMVREVKNKSQQHSLPEAELVAAVHTIEADNHDPRLICRGHDVIAIFSLGLRKRFANHSPNDVSPERLEQFLRVGYQWEHFALSMLYAALVNWEQNNKPFALLRAS